ncbi:MAG: hypothetical protein AAFO03_21915 [Bacteroidota bacterium]
MKTPKTTHYIGAIKLIHLLVLVLLISACDAIRCPASSVSTSPLSSSELQEIVEQTMALQNILGVAVSVVEDGVITHVESFGRLDEARTEDFGNKYAEMTAARKKMIDVETYKVGANWKWAGVWLGSGNSPLNRNYNQNDH